MIVLDYRDRRPLYEQVTERFKELIFREILPQDSQLPSVRSLADTIGINMHTVNKAYAVLKQEGFVKLDRRRGAVVAVDLDKMQALEELMSGLRVLLAKAVCKNITRSEIHDLIDTVMDQFGCPEEETE